jgi:pyruvate/2-oxoglutarate dehydrogenase complex dihydrolipoamide acyltransferase (E2) component
MADWSEQFEDDAPTFLLDIPVLNIDELDLEVNDLRAHVALRAELANLVKINVGVDVYLNEVKLDIKGLEAQALLKINLDRVLGTLDRALEAIDKNPQILSGIAQDVHSGVGGVSRGASQDTRKTGRDVEKMPQLEDAPGRVDEATKETRDGADWETDEAARRDESRSVTKDVPSEPDEVESEEATGSLADLQIEEEYVDDRGRIVGRARDESGKVVEEVLDEEGNVPDLNTPEEAQDRESEDENAGEVDATHAARRKADELGVKLSEVSGTGSGGRVLVKDVEKVAR